MENVNNWYCLLLGCRLVACFEILVFHQQVNSYWLSYSKNKINISKFTTAEKGQTINCQFEHNSLTAGHLNKLTHNRQCKMSHHLKQDRAASKNVSVTSCVWSARIKLRVLLKVKIRCSQQFHFNKSECQFGHQVVFHLS